MPCTIPMSRTASYIVPCILKVIGFPWIAEGLVRSKQGSHLMDMAIGRNYVNLLVDRCFLQNAINEQEDEVWDHLKYQSIRFEDGIHEMVIYIGEKEENCVFKTGQQLSIFPEIHNEECKRISIRDREIRNLPTEF